METFIWRGKEPGPTLLLNGATHGDEYEGPLVLAEMARSWRPKNLRGTVVAIPVLNESAFFAGHRESPLDGKNLARVFPGKRSGSYTEKLAFIFRTRLLRYADYYADFHSAGVSYAILPWVGYCVFDDQRIMAAQRRMAQCFDRFWCWGSPYLPGRTLSAAYEHGVPAIYVECQGMGSVAEEDVLNLRRGLRRLLVAFDFLPGNVRLRKHRMLRESTNPDEGYLQIDHPSPCDGLLMSMIPVGKRIQRGQEIGVVQPLNGSPPRVVRAARNGRAVFIRRQRSVCKGDALATIAPI